MSLICADMTKRKAAAALPIPRVQAVRKSRAKDNLALNIRAWRTQLEPKTVAKLSQKSGVSLKTIYNMQNAVYDPFEFTEAVAQAFGKEAWMLLCPAPLSELAEILHVYTRGDDQDKKDIQFVIDIVRNRIEGER